jgi:outer membrane lipoprotein-sorting protein
MNMKKATITTLVLLSVFSLSMFADKADDYLKKVDEMLSPGNDMTSVLNTVLISKDGSEEVRSMKTYRKGDKKIFFFLSPAGVKGVAFLSLTDDQMYIYMPAFKKVRRIASSSKNENFMGTDLSYEDLAETSLSEKYSPKMISDNDKEAVLELTARPDSDAAYSKLVLTIDKKTWVRTGSEMYDKSGKKVKTMTVSEIKLNDGYPTPANMLVSDILSGHSTRLTISEIKYDSGLTDSLFSTRNIKRIK